MGRKSRMREKKVRIQNPKESLKYSVMLVVDIKGLISDVRSARGLFMILSLIREIGSEVEVRISGYDIFSSICDNSNETLISATAGNFRVDPIDEMNSTE
jgi:hypothetical protein